MADSDLIDRLRGIYRIPITDGLGPAGGEEPDNAKEFVRTFETSPINKEAAERIAADSATITALRDRVAEVERERDDCVALLGGDMGLSAIKALRARATAAEAAIARLRDEVSDVLEFYADPFAYVKKHGLDEGTPDFYDELDTGSRAVAALRALNRDTHHETR